MQSRIFYKHAMILEFTLSSMLRRKYKNAMIVAVYTLLVFLFASLLFLTDALKKEADLLLTESPELIIQRIKLGRHEMVPVDYIPAIRKIRGVGGVTPRFWGYYYDPPIETNYTFLGADEIPEAVSNMVKGSFYSPLGKNKEENDRKLPCIIGQGIADARLIDVDDIIPVLGADGELYVLKVVGIFNARSTILTNDLVVMAVEDIKTIFALPEGMATDLTVQVRNRNELDTVSRKIQALFPTARIISNDQVRSTYNALFGWRSGLAAALLLGVIAAFAILIWDRAMGISDNEKNEIGILKAVGWDTSDILELKFWEGAALSVFSFLTGAIGAYVHVFYFGGLLFAPVLRGWSVLFPEFAPFPDVDIYKVSIIMIFTIFPYLAATIIPSWKVAITDPDRVMR
ncbi:MAG: ABC transporter permease [Thermodesulfobacteriota bacterium]